MLQINGLENGLEIFKCLGSEVRMKIVSLLAENGEMNLNELTASLRLTNGALTPHIRKLTECGIIDVRIAHTGRGLQKVCSLKTDQMLLNVYPTMEERSMKMYETSVRVGYYSNYALKPGCGLAGSDGLIGVENDPRAFSWPERIGAELLWLHDGYVEYRIPNLLPEKQEIVQLTLSFEISGADQGSAEDSLSDLHFFLNGKDIGSWRTIHAGDNSHGFYTPLWWNRPERRCGFLKMLVINEKGVYLDGVQVAQTGEGWRFLDEDGEMNFRLETHPENGRNSGLALYGSGFGNYKQDILVRVHYMPEDT